jgi:uncharacterized protein YciI
MMLVAPLLTALSLLAAAPDEVTPAPATRFFAVEFRTGPRWDAAKPPGEQAYFQDHSQNLKRLRQEGRILLGGRYSDKGFLVVSGSAEEEIRKLFEADPSVANQVFAFDVHEFRPFYPGCVGAKSP